MSSSRLDDALDYLVTQLKAVLPEDWEFYEAEEGAVTALNTVTLYYSQGSFSTTANGVNLPRGHVALDVELTLTAPNSTPAEGRAQASDAALDLCLALDLIPVQVFWDTAERIRLVDTGETAYRFALTYLATFLTPAEPEPEPEPDPEPDPEPEEA